MLATQADVELVSQKSFGQTANKHITFLLDAMSTKFETMVGRTFALETNIAETLDGNGLQTIRLSKYPVATINSITENDTSLLVDVDYLLYADTGQLRRGNGQTRRRWTGYFQAIDVDYDAGYATIPADIVATVAAATFRAWLAAAQIACVEPDELAVALVNLADESTVQYRDTLATAVADTLFTGDEMKVAQAYKPWGFG